MRIIGIIVIGVLFNVVISLAQITVIDIYVYEEMSKQPVQDAYVFIANSTNGSVTDKEGRCLLQVDHRINQELIISHISFAPFALKVHEIYKLKIGDTLFLESSNLALDEIEIVSTRGRKWKKNIKRFEKALLGETKASAKCKLLNPEVLRFIETDNQLKITSIDVLNISNKYLGYDIQFILEELVIKNNGSTRYKGNAFFKEHEDVSKKILKHRSKVHDQSLRSFLRTWIEKGSIASNYTVEEVKYSLGQFYSLPVSDEFPSLVLDSSLMLFKLNFRHFLQVVDKNVKVVSYENVGGVKGLEGRRFNNSQGSEKAIVLPAISQIYKLESDLWLDFYGNIVNNEKVQEYGYWSTLRLGNELPWNYGRPIELDIKVPVVSNNKNDVAQVKRDIIADLIYHKEGELEKTWMEIRNDFSSDNVPPLIDLLRMSSEQNIQDSILSILNSKIGKNIIVDYYSGLNYLWRADPLYNELYLTQKANIYQQIDSRFRKYFMDGAPSLIRLDEIVWGGVMQDGIPALNHPKMILADEASYLNDEDLVFGIVNNGESKSYPKRILAWHEFFIDNIGGEEIAGVYCTLCGVFIPYKTTVNDRRFELGTSGFLYRSNKLLFDGGTNSLWSTIEGKPVLGPLVKDSIQLIPLPVVTTTWGDWKKNYPDSKVLSLETGYNRDYAPGEAYKDYFSTDALMFPVPKLDNRLKNKDEVVVIKLDILRNSPLAISVDFLKKKKMYHVTIDGSNYLFTSSPSGSIRAFQVGSHQYKWNNGYLIDELGSIWEIHDDGLISENGQKFPRITTHRIFWFAWVNAYPDTRLIAH